MDGLNRKHAQASIRAPLWAGVLVGLTLQTAPTLTLAQTFFVTDDLKIPLRSGASRQHRIKTFLNSGTAVISTNNPDESSEWVEVRYKDRRGWLQREHLKTTPTAQMQLAAAQERIKTLEAGDSTQKNALAEAQAQIAALEESLQRAQSNLTDTRAELADLQSLTADTIAVNARNTELTEKLSLLEVREQQLTMENHDLRNDQRRKGMLHGALAVIAGALLAVIIPRLTQKKQRSGWM